MPTLAGAVDTIVDELAAAFEPKNAGARKRRRFILVERGDEYECYRVDGATVSTMARGRLDELQRGGLPRQFLSQPIEVRLDGSRVLSKILKLPAQSRDYLEPIVRHQLDRATPWSADRVVFDYALAEDEPAPEGQIAVRLVATARDVLDRVMTRLTAAGVKADVVGTSEDQIDRPSGVNLLRAETSGQRATLRRRVRKGLLAILIVGVGLSAVTGWRLFALSSDAAEVQAEMDAIRAQIDSARAGMSLSDSRQRLLARKQDEVPLVVLIDKISAALPTNTYLTELTVEDGEVHLVGLTSDAPALIATLEDSDALSDVRFAAPTMRDEGMTEDRFEIAALLETQAAPDDAAGPAEPQ